MNSSRSGTDGLLPLDSAPQHEGAHAPRPLPLFLELVREAGEKDPGLARAALAGLRAYEEAPRSPPAEPRPEVARVRAACLRDHGGAGPACVLVPSLINSPHILDLDEDVSLASAVAGMGRRALLLDWGPASERRDLGIAGHVEALLLPLLREIGEPPALVGYCLGGTMAIAAAPAAAIERIATLAAPWHFDRYPAPARSALFDLWNRAEASAQALGALPMEMLQAAFWSLDPERTVRKFAEFAKLDPDGADARRFVALEDWANSGEPLPCPAARELFEELFGRDRPGNGTWRVAGKEVGIRLAVPARHFTAGRDRIVPAASAPEGDRLAIPAGHVGMIVGSARSLLKEALAAFLDPACR